MTIIDQIKPPTILELADIVLGACFIHKYIIFGEYIRDVKILKKQEFKQMNVVACVGDDSTIDDMNDEVHNFVNILRFKGLIMQNDPIIHMLNKGNNRARKAYSDIRINGYRDRYGCWENRDISFNIKFMISLMHTNDEWLTSSEYHDFSCDQFYILENIQIGYRGEYSHEAMNTNNPFEYVYNMTKNKIAFPIQIESNTLRNPNIIQRHINLVKNEGFKIIPESFEYGDYSKFAETIKSHTECPICLMEFAIQETNIMKVNCCSNLYHINCYVKNIKINNNRCPMCREEGDSNVLYKFKDKNKLNDYNDGNYNSDDSDAANDVISEPLYYYDRQPNRNITQQAINEGTAHNPNREMESDEFIPISHFTTTTTTNNAYRIN